MKYLYAVRHFCRLLCIAVFSLATTAFSFQGQTQRLDDGLGLEFIPVVVHASSSANYGVDPIHFTIQPLNPNVILDALMDNLEGDEAGDLFDKINDLLENPTEPSAIGGSVSQEGDQTSDGDESEGDNDEDLEIVIGDEEQGVGVSVGSEEEGSVAGSLDPPGDMLDAEFEFGPDGVDLGLGDGDDEDDGHLDSLFD